MDSSKEVLLNEAVPTTTPLPINIQDWGLIDYASALQRQMDLVDLVSHELSRETLVFCSHTPVVTIGRGTREGDVFGWQGQVVEVSRGGRATYHGPSQIVVYPILDLNQRGRDLHRYLRLLEESILLCLNDFGVQATGRSNQLDDNGENQEATGVWVGSRKIASLGIGVRRWVSFHGLALNVEADPEAFLGLKPCGFSAQTMISIQEILGTKVDRQKVQKSLEDHLLRKLATLASD